MGIETHDRRLTGDETMNLTLTLGRLAHRDPAMLLVTLGLALAFTIYLVASDRQARAGFRSLVRRAIFRR